MSVRSLPLRIRRQIRLLRNIYHKNMLEKKQQLPLLQTAQAICDCSPSLTTLTLCNDKVEQLVYAEK